MLKICRMVVWFFYNSGIICNACEKDGWLFTTHSFTLYRNILLSAKPTLCRDNLQNDAHYDSKFLKKNMRHILFSVLFLLMTGIKIIVGLKVLISPYTRSLLNAFLWGLDKSCINEFRIKWISTYYDNLYFITLVRSEYCLTKVESS